MEYRNNFEEIEERPQDIKELFKEFISSELYYKWVDTFEVEILDNKKVLVNYYGAESIKEFKKECKVVLFFCIYSALGENTKIKIAQKKSQSYNKYQVNEETNKGANFSAVRSNKNVKAVKFLILAMIFVCFATAIIIVMGNYIGNRTFRETFYNTSSIKVDSNVRVLHLSDLHGVSYGENNKKLLKRVEELKPDVIICTGDMVNSTIDDLSYIKDFSKSLAEIAPSYYIYGNNEKDTIYGFPFNEKDLDEKFGFNKDNRDETAMLTLEDNFEKELESVGIKVLKNEKDTIKVKTMNIDVYGVLNSNPSSFWSYSEKSFLNYIYEDSENLKITAVHEPFIFEEFQPDFWGDLMLCGHTHGGVIRVPVLGPLYTNEGGLLPQRSGKLVYGRFDVAGRPLIISAGLENLSILRINNEPELVIVDINKF